ncbi:MAG: hypothetical protein ACOYKN_18555, partial [Pirellula sp.]
LEAYPTLDGQLRGKARFTHPTSDQYQEHKPNLMLPLAPPGSLAGGDGSGGVRGKPARKAVWLFHQRSISVHQRSRI